MTQSTGAQDLAATPALAPLPRALLVAVGVGLAFAVVLLLSRELWGGRPLSFWLENTAGVWFSAAFVSGLLARRPAYGALAGSGTLLLALFLYDTVSFVTADGFSVQLMPFLMPMWAVISAAVGLGFGLLGGWSAGSEGFRWFGASVVGALLAAEAVALFVDGGPPHPAFDARIAVGQAAVGTGVVLVAIRGRMRWQPAAVFLGLIALIVGLELATGLVTRLVWG